MTDLVERLRTTLHELHAIVLGECPSVLDEDRGGPKQCRFPSDPNAEFFPADMDEAAAQLDAQAAEIERLTKQLNRLAVSFDVPDGGRYLADWESRIKKYHALSARVKELEAERDDALERVDELERNAEVVSDEFEKDCWKAMRSLLTECKYDWRDVEPDGVTADEAREYIHEALNDLESSLHRERDRALRAEQQRDEAYERAAGVAAQKVERYVEGMSGVDVRASFQAGYRWSDGPQIAAAIRRLAAGDEEGN